MSSEIIRLDDLDILADNGEESREKKEIIDYKMVTFSLGGKDYGIDIMKVKEISKASKFTYVPNSVPFVKGVYNLRGDIISVIDLRVMFSIPVPENNGTPENMIILRLEENTIGVIVDTIDKVVGISSEKIQPPHPLFGDINIKFIKGIVENDRKLYIILDVESIFDQESAENAMHQSNQQSLRPAAVSSGAALKGPEEIPDAGGDIDYSFVTETLGTFKNFYVSSVNEKWVKTRFEAWSRQRTESGLDIQLKSAADADAFLQGFESPYSGCFWERDYAEVFSGMLAEPEGGTYNAWNAGCGKGEEAYSITVNLKKKFPGAKIKIFAHDSDLLNISTAPNLVFAGNTIPDIYDDYITEGKNGWHFISDIKDLILFEYHDITNNNQFPPVDLIVARDVLSYMSTGDQHKMIDVFYEKLKPGGILIPGANEIISADGWEAINDSRIPAFRKSR